MDAKARIKELMEERGWSEYRLAISSTYAVLSMCVFARILIIVLINIPPKNKSNGEQHPIKKNKYEKVRKRSYSVMKSTHNM